MPPPVPPIHTDNLHVVNPSMATGRAQFKLTPFNSKLTSVLTPSVMKSSIRKQLPVLP